MGWRNRSRRRGDASGIGDSLPHSGGNSSVASGVIPFQHRYRSKGTLPYCLRVDRLRSPWRRLSANASSCPSSQGFAAVHIFVVLFFMGTYLLPFILPTNRHNENTRRTPDAPQKTAVRCPYSAQQFLWIVFRGFERQRLRRPVVPGSLPVPGPLSHSTLPPAPGCPPARLLPAHGFHPPAPPFPALSPPVGFYDLDHHPGQKDQGHQGGQHH